MSDKESTILSAEEEAEVGKLEKSGDKEVGSDPESHPDQGATDPHAQRTTQRMNENAANEKCADEGNATEQDLADPLEEVGLEQVAHISV